MEAYTPAPIDAPGGGTGMLDLDPVSRVGGALAFHAVLDLDQGSVLESASMATLFRGYEIILSGRDVRDAIFISSRSCGVCGGAHASAAALACEMAFGLVPPPMAVATRNLMSMMECLYDYPTQLFVRAGPDYSETAVRRTSPQLWESAERTPAAGSAVHGFGRIADIMTALERVNGELYLEALRMSRVAREAYVLIGGKYPHPETIVPGGVSATVDTQDINLMLLRVAPFLDYAKKAVAIWNDLVDFFYEADPRYRDVGVIPQNFIDLGHCDDPYAYDASFENCTAWGERRYATPGVIIDGRLVTTSLLEIDDRVEEFVAHSFYDEWTRGGGGGQLPGNHPAGKQTLPQPAERNLRGKYSWSTAPRWDRRAMDTGAYARLWTTALANKLPHRRFVEPTGHSLNMAIPQGALPAAQLEWFPPERWGTFERTRARAYAFAYSAVMAYEHALITLDFRRSGQTSISTPFTVPREHVEGTGFWGGTRGYVSHYMTANKGVIDNYQIIGPSTWSMSPRDGSGAMGPCEQAVAATPLVSSGPAGNYIDVLRTIRSFDPCMPCATH